MKMHIPFFVLALFAAPCAAQDYPQPWHWIVMAPDDQAGWKTQEGENAELTLNGNRFSASLDGGAILLKGSVHGARVVATETVVGTDASPMTFHGEWQRSRTRLTDASNGWGSDRISLTAPGGFYIDLFRHVRSGEPPGKSP